MAFIWYNFTMNFYEYLNVDSNANQQEIRKAFRLLAKKKHPDHNKKESAFWEMVELNVIRDTLLNEEKRRKYDESLAKSHDYHPSHSHTAPSKKEKHGIYHTVKSFFTYKCATCGIKLSSTWKGYCLLHYLESTGQIDNPDFIFEYNGQRYKWADPPEHVIQNQKARQARYQETIIKVSLIQIIIYTTSLIGISIALVLMSLSILNNT